MMELDPETTTRGALMEKSVYKVLELPEILDSILSYLPTIDLLLARCVCKAWNETANQLLIKAAHLPKIKITLRHTGSGFGLQEFLLLSNSTYVSPFFQQLQNYVIDSGDNYRDDIQQIEVDKPHFQKLFSKYAKWIKCIELPDFSSCVITEFVLHKENLGQLPNLQQLKISGKITPEFLQSPNFDILQIARLTVLEFGAAYYLAGQNELLEGLSMVGPRNNNKLSSTILCAGVWHGPSQNLNFNPQVLEELFKNFPYLQVFQNYTGEVRSVGLGRPRFDVDNSLLMAMTTNCCKLKTLKLMMGTTKHFNASQVDRNTFWDFLTSHSNSLESISLSYDSFHDHTNNQHQTFTLWHNLPELPRLTSLELSCCTNLSFLAQTPNLVELSMIDPVLDCFNEFSEVVDCPTLKSLTIGLSLGRNKLSQNAKNQTELVQKVTCGTPNLKEFEMVIHTGLEVLRLELGLKREEVEDAIFKDSRFIEQVQLSQLTETDVQDLEESKNFTTPIINIILGNCHKFSTLDEPIKQRVSSQTSVLLLSRSLSYKELKKLAYTKRLRPTYPRISKYRFIKLADFEELPTTYFNLSKCI